MKIIPIANNSLPKFNYNLQENRFSNNQSYCKTITQYYLNHHDTKRTAHILFSSLFLHGTSTI